MMQQWFGVGNLGRDPEEIETRSGKTMAKFSIAIDDGKDRDPLWFDVLCFNRTAENVLQYLGKGDTVAISGKVGIDNWEDKNGNKRRKYYISAFQVKFLNTRGNRSSREEGRSGGGVDWNVNEEDDPFA